VPIEVPAHIWEEIVACRNAGYPVDNAEQVRTAIAQRKGDILNGGKASLWLYHNSRKYRKGLRQGFTPRS
jgi:hypothetical protein